MALQDLSTNTQDYLKMIWDLQEWDQRPVQPSAIAKKTGMKLSTVSGAMARLSAAGLVEHQPYGGVVLTKRGREYAITMVRRHRLLETFLVQTLGYSWDEVHDEAESLEHAASDRMIERIDDLLGHPDRDPHGDSIPAASGRLPKRDDSITLSQAPKGALVRVDRVSDEDSQMLRYLQSEQVSVGTLLRIAPKDPYSDAVVVSVVTAAAGEAAPASGEKSRQAVPAVQARLAFGPAVAARIRVCLVK
ncbi:transcriptional regulator [Bombiscardovia nodaiensis]|uniref:Manganese transport regulator n=1 Tax=Bombiscardovia nodaiensis TaxID=2932181 RepID=A0ABM8B9R8_9BIFI|nr:transcriptional regulator [Bombiscardovia nodaiensis]